MWYIAMNRNFLREELIKMQTNYTKERLHDIKLKQLEWIKSDNAMSAVYKEKAVLLEQGKVCYAHIVQANTILFGMFPHLDCPAHIVYSVKHCVSDDPGILRDIATNLYSYKNKPLESVPIKGFY